MPNIKSAVKRMRQSEERRLLNRSEKSHVTTVRRRMDATIDSGNAEEATKEFGLLCSVLDKAVKHGTMKKNTCDRYKSRAHVRINALSQG